MFVLLICELYIDVYYQGDVKRLHQQSENQFDRSKLYVDFIWILSVLNPYRYADNHNQVVADYLISQLQDKFHWQESDIKSM